MATPLALEHGSFAYDRPIFADLSLSLERGLVDALLGPNGCGKTTLLRCLGGALALREGQVFLEGREMSAYGEAERARRIAFVFQEHHTVFPYSVLEAVRMGRTPHLGFLGSPGRGDTAIAERALNTVGCLHLRAARYTEISGGERQLVLIARALAQEPSILLLDEPTSHLDLANVRRTLGVLQSLRADGRTIILTTHDPNAAAAIADDVLLMRQGRVIGSGPTGSVMNSERLSATYGVPVEVMAVRGRPLVLNHVLDGAADQGA